MSGTPRSEALSALSQFLVAEVSVGETLRHITEITSTAIEPAAFVGISMLDSDGHPTTALFTDKESPEIDSAQYDAGRGPCLDAWREQEVVRVADTEADDTPYPEFNAKAAAHGIHSTLSLPLMVGDGGIGAMNLYATAKDAFSAEDEALGVDLATAASVVLANATAYWGVFELSQHLNMAMQSRAVIEQAKGILMGQTPGLNPDDAFKMLVKASQRENLKLRDIATRIVERRPPPTPSN